MYRNKLKELKQEVYDDYYFVDFNLHFVNEVQTKIYEIKNNHINNILKDTKLIVSNYEVSNEQLKEMLLYEFDDDCIKVIFCLER